MTILLNILMHDFWKCGHAPNKDNKMKHTIALLLAILSAAFGPAVLHAETQYLLPDSYELNVNLDSNSIKLNSTLDGYHAVLSFKPRYEAARNFLKVQYGSDYENLDIVELPVNSENFTYIHEGTLGSLILRKMESFYFGPEIRVVLDFSSEFSIEQIQNLLSFNLVYGMAKAKVICNGSTVHMLCDQALPSLPVFNQYQLANNAPAKKRLTEDYLVLTEYRNRIEMENRMPAATRDTLDSLARQDLFIAHSSCRDDLNSYRLGICNSIRALSPTRLSLVEAIVSLANRIYPMNLDDAAIDSLIVRPVVNNGSQDNGRTMQAPKFFVSQVAVAGIGPVEVRDIAVSGPRVYAATGSGLAVSTDYGRSFILKTIADGLGSDYITSITLAGSKIYVATQGGGIAISSDGANTFNSITTANGLATNWTYDIAVDGNSLYVATLEGISISHDGGQSFFTRNTSHGLGANYVRAVALNGRNIYAATVTGLSISRDGGDSFVTRKKQDGLSNNVVNDVYVTDSAVYAATDRGLNISTDGGKSFKARFTGNGLGNNGVMKVRVVGSTVFAGTINGLSVSENRGDTFVNLTQQQGLADNRILSLAIADDTVYVGTSTGISVSQKQSKPAFKN
jgi:hypothetical protein